VDAASATADVSSAAVRELIGRYEGVPTVTVSDAVALPEVLPVAVIT